MTIDNLLTTTFELCGLKIFFTTAAVCVCVAQPHYTKIFGLEIKKFWNSRNLANPFMIKVTLRSMFQEIFFVSIHFRTNRSRSYNSFLNIFAAIISNLLFRFSEYANVLCNNSKIYRFLTI